MKRILMMSACLLVAGMLRAQSKIDDQKMERDIEVAENVLSTLIRQQFSKRNFFPFDVEATYSQGYGVTFRIPSEVPGPMIFSLGGGQAFGVGQGGSYSFSYSSDDDDEDKDCEDCVKEEKAERAEKAERREKAEREDRAAKSDKDRAMVWVAGKSGHSRRTNYDSLSKVYNTKVIDASKEFIADYGDLIGQLTPEERIKITNRNDGQRYWFSGDNAPRRRFISMECLKADITQFKQGKITRDQLMAKISVIDSETSEEVSSDLELLSTMFNRLYRPDLSKTFYVQEDVYYERLKNYGAVFYMQVYSSSQIDQKRYDMPTINLERIDKETRDKKVKELYPVFEKEVKENMLDYGRTLKTLKDNELLVMNIKLTQCAACGIPVSLELSVKNSVLRDFSSGKLSKEAAVGMIIVKKGANQ